MLTEQESTDSVTSEIEYQSLSDFIGSLELISTFYKEAGSANFGINLDALSLSQTLLKFIIDKETSFIEIASRDSKVIGIIVGGIERNPLDYYQLIGREQYWYVEKEYRSKGVGDSLLRHFEDFCQAKGCHLIYMGSLPHIESNAKKYYESRDYHPLELTWVKKVEAQND